MIQEQEKHVWNLGLKEEKNYEILLEELQLQGEYIYKVLFMNDFWRIGRNILAEKRWHNYRKYSNEGINHSQIL